MTAALFTKSSSEVVTAGWTGTVKHWECDPSTQAFTCKKEWKDGHEDRITGMKCSPNRVNLATASLDGTARIWNGDGESVLLKGHQKRLCKVAWHPSGDYVGTTSADLTWRLWDAGSGKELLLQDGHFMEAYGIAFNSDGSLVSTTDFGGIVQIWDLRTGKNIQVGLAGLTAARAAREIRGECDRH